MLLEVTVTIYISNVENKLGMNHMIAGLGSGITTTLMKDCWARKTHRNSRLSSPRSEIHIPIKVVSCQSYAHTNFRNTPHTHGNSSDCI